MRTYVIGILKYAVIMPTVAFVEYYQAIFIIKDEVIIEKITNNKIINCGGIPIKNVKRINGYDKDHNLKERLKMNKHFLFKSYFICFIRIKSWEVI